VQALGVAAGGDQELCCGDRTDAPCGNQVEVDRRDQIPQLFVDQLDLLGEEAVALGQRLHREQDLGHDAVSAGAVASWAWILFIAADVPRPLSVGG
jgi:hypothetical protein